MSNVGVLADIFVISNDFLGFWFPGFTLKYYPGGSELGVRTLLFMYKI